MRNMRQMGDAIEREVSHRGLGQQLREVLGITECEGKRLYRGMLLLTWNDLQKVAGLCNVPVKQLIEPDREAYERHMEQVCGHFEDPENREDILDLIEDYIFFKEAVCRI